SGRLPARVLSSRSLPPTPFYASPAVYPPVTSTPPMYAPPSATPPTAGVIDYPEGRYELRGDGFSVPYAWVWVPNPPPAPPVAAAAPAIPPAPKPPPPPAPVTAPPPTPAVIYQWVDERGVVHFTDDKQKVPERDRSRVISSDGGRPG